MKMASTPTENKRFTTRYDTDPIFMPGGAPTAHKVLTEERSLQFQLREDNCSSEARHRTRGL